MPRRPKETPLTKETLKRKHLSLSIQKKVELLKRLDKGASVRLLCHEYGVGNSTIYDLKKNKQAILKFYAESDVPKMMNKRKTLHQAKNVDVDKVLVEWVRQRRSEKLPLDRAVIMAQAKKFHKDLELTTKCEYTPGWFNRFKHRHGFRNFKVCGEKASEDHEAVEAYLNEFAPLVCQEKLSPEQEYNVDETALYPRKTYVTPDKVAPCVFKDSNKRLTILGCRNGAATHMGKLIAIGKRKKPRDSDENNAQNHTEKVSIDECIGLTVRLIKGLEQKSFISEQQVMWLYKIQNTLINEKPKYMKQLKLQYILDKIIMNASEEQASTSGVSSSTPEQPAAVVNVDVDFSDEDSFSTTVLTSLHE